MITFISTDEAPAHFDARDEKLANSSFTLDSSSNGRLKRSAIILSQTPDKCFDDDGLLQEDDFALRSTPISKNATNVIKYFQQTNRLSARCYPFTGKTEQSRNQSDKVDSDTEQCISCELEDVGDPIGPYGARTSYQALPKERDFIRRLPVHLSKYILGFLNQYCLINCVCVSKHWRFLAEQVRNDTLAQQIMREDVMLIQVNLLIILIKILGIPLLIHLNDYCCKNFFRKCLFAIMIHPKTCLLLQC